MDYDFVLHHLAKYDYFLNFLLAYIYDRREGNSEVAVEREAKSMDRTLKQEIIDDAKQILALHDFPWEAIQQAANIALYTEDEVRGWLKNIISILEKHYEKGQ